MDTTLRVSDDRRSLLRADATPFFYLGDTAWELFHRLDRDEADVYLRNRAAKGFTVIQAVVLAELDGLSDPNPYGATPLIDNDPTRPSEAYFQHVDWIVARAADLGLLIGMLPTWGDKWYAKWGRGPEIFTPANAEVYGEWLARRYRDAPLIWILGGDRCPETPEHFAVIRSMARGIRRGDGGRHLISFHPWGQRSSAEFFHDDDWLDFNMLQSGHTRDRDNYRSVAEDYARRPVKPCMDAEPGYEDHPSGFDPANGYLDAADVRKFAYWALLAGACGHTYGCHDIWQMWQPGRAPITAARTPWREALDLPGATQVGYARALLESRPFLTRVPDQSLVVGDQGSGATYIAAMRDAAGALIYVPDGRPLTLATATLGGALAATWFDPRSGTRQPAAAQASTATFTPPTAGDDWVLVLDTVQ